MLAGSCECELTCQKSRLEVNGEKVTLDTSRLTSTVTIFCSPVNPAMFFLPTAAAFIGPVLKLAKRTSCVEDEADIDARGNEAALLLCRSTPARVLSSLDEEGWEAESVIAGEVDSLLL